jgi:hypothetical protein
MPYERRVMFESTSQSRCFGNVLPICDWLGRLIDGLRATAGVFMHESSLDLRDDARVHHDFRRHCVATYLPRDFHQEVCKWASSR